MSPRYAVRPALFGDLTSVLDVLAQNRADSRPADVPSRQDDTASDKQLQGVATLLLEQLLADARSADCYEVQLLSHKRHASDGAHALYSGLGLAPEAEGFRNYLT